ncbi:MAG: carbohydrate kinase [Rhodanobacter sp.]
MKGILCFGEALIDFHRQAPGAPGAPPAFVPYTGGAPANVAVAAAKLGGRAAFVGMLGQDMFGDMLLASLQDMGVDTRYVVRTDAALTALAFVSLDDRGERSFSFYRPPSADLLFVESDFDERAFAGAGVFHVCSNSLTEASIAATTVAGMARAHANDVLVSFDMNLRPALWARGQDPLPHLWEALLAADLVKLSAEEFAFLAGSAGDEAGVRARLWQGHARWLLVTDGGAPIRWFTPDQAGAFPAFNLPAVDTTGAGDAFVGGLIYGLADAGTTPSDLPLLIRDGARRDELLRFAAACGALAVTRTGSFAAMPTLAQVRQLLDGSG